MSLLTGGEAYGAPSASAAGFQFSPVPTAPAADRRLFEAASRLAQTAPPPASGSGNGPVNLPANLSPNFDLPPGIAPVPQEDGTSPSLETPLEDQPLPDPANDEPLLPSPPSLPLDLLPEDRPVTPEPQGDPAITTLTVERFEIVGSTVFSDEALRALSQPYTQRPITFDDVRKLRDDINKAYRQAGYVTSGAIIPEQTVADGVVKLQVIEGSVEDIVVDGNQRLQPSYISSRLSLATGTPLNRDRLLEQLQLLRLDPLIQNISADLQAGTRPGTNLLVVSVVEADSVDVGYTFDNNRSPTVGTQRHQFRASQRNLSGLGDVLSLGYTLTRGSNDLEVAYTRFINPRNGTLTFSFGDTNSDVIEDPFDVLEISSDARVIELTLRQPIVRTPTQELALGLIASRQSTQTFLGIDDIGGFPLSDGADEAGRTRVTALRFFQEWTQRSTEQVFALRSQFNVGIDALDATLNEGDTPDGEFFSWLGQGQWVRLLGPNTPLVLRGSVQLTPDPLLSLERYSLGGLATVRGYRQDELLTDNGANLSLEVRIPLWQNAARDGLLQVTPFIEGGYGWNTEEEDPEPGGLLGIGTGLLFQIKHLNLRFDYGIPLIDSDDGDTLQEQGVYFSIGVSF